METKIFEFVPEESEHFESQFLKWYDAGKPKNNFNEAYDYSTITQFFFQSRYKNSQFITQTAYLQYCILRQFN